MVLNINQVAKNVLYRNHLTVN